MRRSEYHQKGFTLLEIIVALAITAVGIAAAARYTVSASTVAFETEQRMLAVWTAGNRLSELRIERAWPPPGVHNRQYDMGGRTWYLTETVSDTDQPNLRRVDIVVYADPDQAVREFSLYGYLARYLPPEELGPQGPGGGGPQDGQGSENGDGSESLSADDEEIPLPGDEPEEVPLPGDEEQQAGPGPGEDEVQESETDTEPAGGGQPDGSAGGENSG